jgi:hypothetical protein
MKRGPAPRVVSSLCLFLGVAASSTDIHATQVWSGRTYGFSKAPYADPTQPENQDRITPLVWITRGTIQGIYNIKVESGYVRGVSPSGTEWATGDAVDYASLTFRPWEAWTGNNPPATVGVDAVVHLIVEDIYIDIRFDSWSVASGGGGFSYHRAFDPATAAAHASWGQIKAFYR